MSQRRLLSPRVLAVLLVGILAGALALGPASAHLGTPRHLWREHIKPKVVTLLGNYYTKSQSDSRYYTKSQTGRLLPKTEADVDSAAGQTSVTDLTTVTITSLSLSAPASGCVVLDGAVMVNNFTGTSREFSLQFLRNGTGIAGALWIEFSDTAGDSLTLAGTTRVSVGAGTHTFSATLSGSLTDDADYDSDNLVATWYPASRC